MIKFCACESCDTAGAMYMVRTKRDFFNGTISYAEMFSTRYSAPINKTNTRKSRPKAKTIYVHDVSYARDLQAQGACVLRFFNCLISMRIKILKQEYIYS